MVLRNNTMKFNKLVLKIKRKENPLNNKEPIYSEELKILSSGLKIVKLRVYGQK
jgi:hypothetical protein